jgi:rhodanese-related sulfurtransferase
MQFVLANWYLFVALVVILVMLALPTVLQHMHGIRSLTPSQAVLLANREAAVVVDVREPNAYRAGHVPNAVNVPLAMLAQAAPLLQKYKQRPLIVVCRTDQRALRAARLLHKQGFPSVHMLAGGVAAWERASLPLEK